MTKVKIEIQSTIEHASRVLVAAVLFLAGTDKIGLERADLHNTILGNSIPFGMPVEVIAFAEMVFGCWLFFTKNVMLAWTGVLVTFSGFSAILWKGHVTGLDMSCGCTGTAIFSSFSSELFYSAARSSAIVAAAAVFISWIHLKSQSIPSIQVDLSPTK
jgi:hypothetical protein